MFDELIDFLEGVFVEQQADAITRAELAFRLLPFEAIFAAPQFGSGVEVQ
jgi:hypothetical protein